MGSSDVLKGANSSKNISSGHKIADDRSVHSNQRYI